MVVNSIQIDALSCLLLKTGLKIGINFHSANFERFMQHIHCGPFIVTQPRNFGSVEPSWLLWGTVGMFAIFFNFAMEKTLFTLNQFDRVHYMDLNRSGFRLY